MTVAPRRAFPALHCLTGFRTCSTTGYCTDHHHPGWEVVYHRNASGTTTLQDGTALTFSRGSAVFYPPETGHDQTCRPGGEDYCIVFLAAPGQLPLDRARVIPPPLGAYARREFAALSQLAPNRDDQENRVIDHRTSALVFHLLRHRGAAAATADAAGRESHARRARQYIRNHFATISAMADVARHVGISADHLRHVFRQAYGIPPVAWLHQVRLDRALDLLAFSQLSLKEIAGRCGFANERYFSTCFRRAMGCPPGAWRRRQNRPSS